MAWDSSSVARGPQRAASMGRFRPGIDPDQPEREVRVLDVVVRARGGRRHGVEDLGSRDAPADERGLGLLDLRDGLTHVRVRAVRLPVRVRRGWPRRRPPAPRPPDRTRVRTGCSCHARWNAPDRARPVAGLRAACPGAATARPARAVPSGRPARECAWGAAGRRTGGSAPPSRRRPRRTAAPTPTRGAPRRRADATRARWPHRRRAPPASSDEPPRAVVAGIEVVRAHPGVV